MGLGILGAAWLLSGCDTLPVLELTVTTIADGNDADPGDGVCEMTDGLGDCSLRAAVDEANATTDHDVRVALPAGTYALTPDGSDEDANQTGDLDVNTPTSLTLVGQGAGAVIDATASIGAVEALDGGLTIRRLAVTGADERALLAQAGTTLLVDQSAVHDNPGIGIITGAGGTAIMSNSTVSGNDAGIFNNGTTVTAYSTITNNDAGGILGPGAATLTATIVAHQDVGSDCAAPVTSLGHNLDSDGTCGLTQTGDQPYVVDLGLEPLSTEAVPFHGLGPLSPAVDLVPSATARCPDDGTTLDQTGAARPLGSGCDAGAVEGSGSPPLMVDSPLDTRDAAPGDGVCADAAGACTVRAAIEETNAQPGPDIITIANGVHPTLSRAGAGEELSATGDLDIAGDTTILGNGATIDAASLDRVIDIRTGIVAIDQLTIVGGVADSGGGIAIQVDATAAIDRSTVWGNHSTDAMWCGWVVDPNFGYAECEGAPTGGAGLRNDGALAVKRSTISANVTDGECGVISSPDPRFPDSMWCDVTAGAGIYTSLGGHTTVADSTITGNTVTAGFGAAIATEGWSSVGIVGSTIGSNVVQHQFSPPDLPSRGTQLAEIGDDGGLGLRNSIVVGTSTACSGVSSGGYNVALLCGSHSSDVHVNPLLGPLADNGGPTLTQLPLAGSPAIDLIPEHIAWRCHASLGTDQRGVTRPLGARCDAGAVEQ